MLTAAPNFRPFRSYHSFHITDRNRKKPVHKSGMESSISKFAPIWPRYAYISDLDTRSMNLSAWGNPTAKRIRVGSLCVTLALPITEKAIAELQKGNHGIRHQSKEYFTRPSPKIPEENPFFFFFFESQTYHRNNDRF